MSNLKITPGKISVQRWNGEEWPEKRLSINSSVEGAVCINSRYVTQEQAQDNFELYADAHNTYNSCGILPSTLYVESEKINKKNNTAKELLLEATLQIEYLQDKFKETGSGNSVVSKIKAFLTEK